MIVNSKNPQSKLCQKTLIVNIGRSFYKNSIYEIKCFPPHWAETVRKIKYSRTIAFAMTSKS
jgi:hypothetical protein